MFIGYSYHVEYIKKFAPSRFKFNTAPISQLTKINPAVLANYWGETVSKNSEHPNEAWDFIQFAASRSNNSTYARATGRVSAREDKRELFENKNYYGPVAQQIKFSRSWYRNNTTAIEDIFAEMINNVIHNNVLPSMAIDTAVRDINQLD